MIFLRQPPDETDIIHQQPTAIHNRSIKEYLQDHRGWWREPGGDDMKRGAGGGSVLCAGGTDIG